MRIIPEIDPVPSLYNFITALSTLSQRDLCYLKPPKTGDQKEDKFLRDYLKCFGFDGHPEVLTKVEIDEYIKNGERELFRGISDNSTFCDDFRYGELFVGCGYTGNGIYTAYGVNKYGETAVLVASNYGEHILRMSLKADAKVIDYDDLDQIFIETTKQIDKQIKDIEYLQSSPREVLEALKNRILSDPDYCYVAKSYGYEAVISYALSDRKMFKLIVLSDYGRLAAVLGYDAIDVKDNNEMVLLKRTAVRVQDTNFD